MRLLLLVIAALALGSNRAHADIDPITIQSPYTSLVAYDTVEVRAIISSAYDVSANAYVDASHMVSLSRVGATSTFRGTLPLVGLPDGATTVYIHAVDTGGDMETVMTSFTHEAPVDLAVTSPSPWSVARPSVHVTGTCSDAGAPCPYVKINFASVEVQLTNVSSFDEVISLASFDGADVSNLVVSSKGGSKVEVPIAVETSAQLIPIMEVPGPVDDADTGRALFRTRPASAPIPDSPFFIYHRVSGVIEPLLGASSNMDSYLHRVAYLTSRGAVWMTELTGTGQRVARESRDGAIIEHGPVIGLHAAGDYVVFYDGNNDSHRLQVSTGTVVTIPWSATIYARVTPEGVVAFHRLGVYRWPGSGSPVPLGGDILLDVDATRTAFTVGNPYNFQPCEGFVRTLPDAAESMTLVPLSPCPWPVLLGDGWTAMLRVNGGGELVVWMRSPTGVTTQVSPFVGPHGLIAVAADEVMVQSDGVTKGLYRMSTTSSALRVASHGRVIRSDGEWLVVIAGAVHAIGVVTPPMPDAGVPDGSVPDAGPDAPEPTADATEDDVDAAGDPSPSPGCGGCIGSDASSAWLAIALVFLAATRRRRRTR